MYYTDISAEWKTLRKNMGGFLCHVDNMMTKIENGEKKLAESKKSDIDKIYSALSSESQRIIFAMAQKFLDLESNDGGKKDA